MASESMALEFFTVRQLRRFFDKGLLPSMPTWDMANLSTITFKEARVARAVEMLLPFSTLDYQRSGAESWSDMLRKLMNGECIHVGDLMIMLRED